MGELVEGINIKKCQCVITIEGARSEFEMRAQTKADDDKWGRKASEQEARIKGLLDRYSILISAIEHPVYSQREVQLRVENDKMWNEDATIIDCTITTYGWFRPLPTSVFSWATQFVHREIGHTLWQAGDEV